MLRGIRHKVLDQVKRKKSSFPEDDMHQRIKEVIFLFFCVLCGGLEDQCSLIAVASNEA